MTLNSRGLRSYSPVLLFSAIFLLAVLALGLSSPITELASSGGLSSAPAPWAERQPASAHSDRPGLQHLPLGFEPNQGQAGPQVKFLAHGAGYGVFLAAGRTVLSVRSSSGRNSGVDMRFAGSNPNPAARALDPLPGRSNYLIGNDPKAWHRNVPQFARIRYENLYPGIDLVYYGTQGRLEYDFVVSPHANPSAIALRFPGSGALKIDANGDLVLNADQGSIRLKAPRTYQLAGSDRQVVAGRYLFRANGDIGFEVGPYDRRRALVIDPVLVYSSYFGGSGNESCSLILGVASPPSGCPAVAVDASANIYLAGSTSSTNLPLTPSSATDQPFQTTLAGTANAFVTKLNAAGSAIVFSTYLGGDGVDTTAGVAVDSAFNVIVAGTTTSSNFPTSGSSAFQSTRSNANTHAFVSKLDATGTNLAYSTYLSGNGAESARGVAVDSKSKIYVIGTTTSTDQPSATASFPATLGAIQVASLAQNQFFVSKIDPTLIGFASLPYSTYFGGGNPANGVVVGGGIAVDANSNVYITGGTNFQHTGSASTDFPILNAYQGCLDTPPSSSAPTTCPTGLTATDAFAAKINPSASAGAQLLYSTYLGGAGEDVGYAIAVDSSLSSYVTGSTTSNGASGFIIPSGTTAFQGSNGGGIDAFVAKLGNPCTGASCTTTTVPLNYFSYLGGAGTDVGLGIAVDTLQGARITGWTTSGDFPHPNNPVQAALSGTTDAFVARIDTTASSALALGHYGTYLGGGSVDFGTSIATDTQGNSYVAGETRSGDFPRATPLQNNLSGGSDAFVSKLGPTINLALTETVSPNPVGIGNSATFTYSLVNNGDLTTGIIFTDALPATGATFVSANSSPGQTNCPATGATVTCAVGTLNGGATATVRVVQTPTVAGSLSEGGRVTVFGTNVVVTPAPPPAVATVNDFSISVSPDTQTVAAGVPAPYTVTVTPTGNIPETVSLSASGAPSGGTSTFPNGASFANLSSGPQSRQLVVNTTARVTTPASLFPSGKPFYAVLLPVSGLALLGSGIGGKKSRRRIAFLPGLLFSLIIFQAACGSSRTTSTTTGTPAGTYNLTVTATSGSASRTQQIVLVVQ